MLRLFIILLSMVVVQSGRCTFDITKIARSVGVPPTYSGVNNEDMGRIARDCHVWGGQGVSVCHSRDGYTTHATQAELHYLTLCQWVADTNQVPNTNQVTQPQCSDVKSKYRFQNLDY